MVEDITIRKFTHADVDDFLRISRVAFADESRAAGITPEDFERETRRIFRWKMIPYILLTALMGVRWEGFVVEYGGRVVGGGMYVGKDRRMTVTNLMVDPAYRRRGIGQALLIRRLERLSELGYSYVTAQVLDTNFASLGNLKKQGFEEYNRYSVYECQLPIIERESSENNRFTLRDLEKEDLHVFKEFESRTTAPLALAVNGSLYSSYFLSAWQRIFLRYTGYTCWIRTILEEGRIVGFLRADYQRYQTKGSLLLPVMRDEALEDEPGLIRMAAGWLQEAHRVAAIMEVSDGKIQLSQYLQEHGWTKKYTWIELIKWLDERVRDEFLGIKKRTE